MLISPETTMAEHRAIWPGSASTAARPIVPLRGAMPSARRSRQDWLAEAMQCLCYENLSARSPD